MYICNLQFYDKDYGWLSLTSEKKELVGGNCENYGGFACGCLPDTSVYNAGKLCVKYRDKKIGDLSEIILYLMVQDLYNRSEVDGILNGLEEFYKDIVEQ